MLRQAFGRLGTPLRQAAALAPGLRPTLTPSGPVPAGLGRLFSVGRARLSAPPARSFASTSTPKTPASGPAAPGAGASTVATAASVPKPLATATATATATAAASSQPAAAAAKMATKSRILASLRTPRGLLRAGLLVLGTGALLSDSGRWCVRASQRFVLAFALTVASLSRYLWELRDDKQDEAAWSRAHTFAATLVAWYIRQFAGVFVKVAQHAASLEYLLPEEITSAMVEFQDAAPRTTPEEVIRVLETELGMPIQQAFQSFDLDPVGAASLAQVHRAVLWDGREVAVKVQHPRLLDDLPVDLRILELCSTLFDKFLPGYSLQWLLSEIQLNLPRELDFVHEALNADRARKAFASRPDSSGQLSAVHATGDPRVGLIVPEIHWSMTTPRVLVMEFAEGKKMKDTAFLEANNISPQRVAAAFSHLFGHMVFEAGLLHADMHPGNVLINPRPKPAGVDAIGPHLPWWARSMRAMGLGRLVPQGTTDAAEAAAAADRDFDLVLLDHGLYRELSENFQLDYSRLWLGILDQDELAVKRASARLGAGPQLYRLFASIITARPWDMVVGNEFIVDEDGRVVYHDNKPAAPNSQHVFIDRTNVEVIAIRKSLEGFILDIFSIMQRIPRELIMVIKSNDLVRHVVMDLQRDDGLSTMLQMTRFCAQTAYRHESSPPDLSLAIPKPESLLPAGVSPADAKLDLFGFGGRLTLEELARVTDPYFDLGDSADDDTDFGIAAARRAALRQAEERILRESSLLGPWARLQQRLLKLRLAAWALDRTGAQTAVASPSPEAGLEGVAVSPAAQGNATPETTLSLAA
ncbi:Atypical/ABC1/ABC1-B protein kinase [Fonticula alba]|uniref:Atypical/ABC1/ABC1-B protein kinase n=1 Tax=Fonticula alba TaxID=691883 RepID=A0A058Z6M3_FONAL|nr:Atypical/ABC1/ABC1-B protein kinase [Fonticula alba]KCV69182.1 Atypical/ABC1/ABC1-B protein kinase [Fonticula alba]|eukprot:XP_009496753.1 Atypical/ABC1/ABC1-B protein kinase [Fonticula alba]